MLRAHKLLVFVILVVTAVAMFAGWLIALHPFTGGPGGQGMFHSVVLDGQLIHVTVADTDVARSQGLGGRQGLAPNEGMLFVFPSDDRYSFWMKDMLFSIDILWLSSDGHVLYIQEQVSPGTYPRTFSPGTPARYVLELPAGYVAKHQVQIGDVVRL